MTDYPCDVEPRYEPISISPYLLKPCRTVQQAARDILRRQLEQSVVVIELAAERAKRRKW